MLIIKKVGRDVVFTTENTTSFRVWPSIGDIDVQSVINHVKESGASKEEIVAWVDSRTKTSTSDTLFLTTELVEKNLVDLIWGEEELAEEDEVVPVKVSAKKLVGAK